MTEQHGFGIDFHDAGLSDFRLGPRRELTLLVALNNVLNPKGREVTVRFGGIENYDEVTSFFVKIKRPDFPGSTLDRIDDLVIDEIPASNRTKRVVIDLDHNGTAEIACRHVTVR